ncbi:hypothetical protein D3C81_1875100 [compost metagenome]
MLTTSDGFGVIMRVMNGMTTMSARVMKILKSVNRVSLTGINPATCSTGLPGVAASNGIEPEKPPPQVRKPM